MHFEFLVEDRSGRAMLERLVPKIISEKNTFTIHAYKGIGRIPKNLNPKSDPDKRILLDQLPRLLGGYGKAFHSYPADYRAAVIVVCDLDDRDLKDFTEELVEVQRKVTPSPKTEFCIATWETLADAVYPGGSGALNAQGYQLVGKEKTRWAEDITPHMDVAVNKSPSFERFREALENFENTDD